ncbi:protein arginine methyltransferase NDUFAF7, mitochondrial-like isoform X2 [Dysidea avara]
MQRDVFGKKGDFITSPEVSQVFGELIGVWVVAEWIMAGKPKSWQLVELGPGRGTLLADMLRVFEMLKVPVDGLSVHLVELSPALCGIQEETLTGTTHVAQPSLDLPPDHEGSYRSCKLPSGASVSWYRELNEVPTGLSYYIAHEFFDALPVHQFQRSGDEWREKLVGIDQNEALTFTLAPGPTPATVAYHEILDISSSNEVEISPNSLVMMGDIATRVQDNEGAALLVDYGSEGSHKHTFRAFRSHQACDPLVDPGSCDLTADVDFAALKDVAITNGVAVHGPITQNAFLHKMGIRERIESLQKSATNSQCERLLSDYEMLTNPKQMGERFKFMAVTKNHRHSPTPF